MVVWPPFEDSTTTLLPEEPSKEPARPRKKPRKQPLDDEPAESESDAAAKKAAEVDKAARQKRVEERAQRQKKAAEAAAAKAAAEAEAEEAAKAATTDKDEDAGKAEEVDGAKKSQRKKPKAGQYFIDRPRARPYQNETTARNFATDLSSSSANGLVRLDKMHLDPVPATVDDDSRATPGHGNEAYEIYQRVDTANSALVARRQDFVLYVQVLFDLCIACDGTAFQHGTKPSTNRRPDTSMQGQKRVPLGFPKFLHVENCTPTRAATVFRMLRLCSNLLVHHAVPGILFFKSENALLTRGTQYDAQLFFWQAMFTYGVSCDAENADTQRVIQYLFGNDHGKIFHLNPALYIMIDEAADLVETACTICKAIGADTLHFPGWNGSFRKGVQ
jgi:hypothetical protein